MRSPSKSGFWSPTGSTSWTMYTLSGRAGDSDWYCLPNVAADRVVSPAVEDVLLARDEMANVVWAVERRVEGPLGTPVDRASEGLTDPLLAPPDADPASPRWVLGTTVPPFWYPLQVQPNEPSQLVVGMTGTGDTPPRGTFVAIGATVAADAVPREGRRLHRDYVSVRGSDGSTLLWSRRRAAVGRGESSSGLAFDLADSRRHP